MAHGKSRVVKLFFKKKKKNETEKRMIKKKINHLCISSNQTCRWLFSLFQIVLIVLQFQSFEFLYFTAVLTVPL